VLAFGKKKVTTRIIASYRGSIHQFKEWDVLFYLCSLETGIQDLVSLISILG
jgi:hypothetical protein